MARNHLIPQVFSEDIARNSVNCTHHDDRVKKRDLVTLFKSSFRIVVWTKYKGNTNSYYCWLRTNAEASLLGFKSQLHCLP